MSRPPLTDIGDWVSPSTLIENMRKRAEEARVKEAWEEVFEDEGIAPAYYTKSHLPFIHESGLARGWLLGNVIKYVCRAGKKDGEPERKDLLKAKRCLELYLSLEEGSNER